MTVRGSHASANDIARDFEEAFGSKPQTNHHGSLEDLYNTMHGIRKQQPQNVWGWLPLFYTYYSTNGQGALREPLDNDRYPDMKMTTLLEYFKALKQPDRIGTPFDVLD